MRASSHQSARPVQIHARGSFRAEGNRYSKTCPHGSRPSGAEHTGYRQARGQSRTDGSAAIATSTGRPNPRIIAACMEERARVDRRERRIPAGGKAAADRSPLSVRLMSDIETAVRDERFSNTMVWLLRHLTGHRQRGDRANPFCTVRHAASFHQRSDSAPKTFMHRAGADGLALGLFASETENSTTPVIPCRQDKHTDVGY